MVFLKYSTFLYPISCRHVVFNLLRDMQQRTGNPPSTGIPRLMGFCTVRKEKYYTVRAITRIVTLIMQKELAKAGELLWGAIAEGVKGLHMIQILWL